MVPKKRVRSKLAERTLTVLRRGTAHQVGNSLYYVSSEVIGAIQIALHGTLDETSDLSAIFKLEGVVHLDLAAVSGINSMGVSVWINAKRNRSPELRLRLRRCSPPFVEQMNLLPEFTSDIEIASLIAPYVCPHCTRESDELLEIAEIEDVTPPLRRCSECSTQLDLDDLPEVYFAFLR